MHFGKRGGTDKNTPETQNTPTQPQGDASEAHVIGLEDFVLGGEGHGGGLKLYDTMNFIEILDGFVVVVFVLKFNF